MTFGLGWRSGCARNRREPVAIIKNMEKQHIFRLYKELRDAIKSMQSDSFGAVLHLSLFHIFSHIDISEGGFGSVL